MDQIKQIKHGENLEVEETKGTVYLWFGVSWLFGFCFCANIAITAIYFIFLDDPNLGVIWGQIVHITPLLATTIDFVLNLVVIELNLIIWTTVIVLLYMLNNFIWTIYINQFPVYWIITWTSVPNSVRDVVMYTAVGVFLHLIGWLLTWLKFWLQIRDEASEDLSHDIN